MDKQISAVEYIVYIGNRYGVDVMVKEYELIKNNRSVRLNKNFWGDVWHEVSKQKAQNNMVAQVNELWNS